MTTSADPRAAGLDPQALDRLRATLQARVDAGRLPGAVWLVVRNGVLGCFDTLGRLDPVHDTPMPRDAIFRIYSMTKPIASVAALRLVERGRLSLSDPVATHLPEFAATQVGIERDDGQLELVATRRPITVHDLLRHTSGGTLHGQRILGRKTVEWMTADHIGDLPRHDMALAEGFGFGLGVAVRTHAGLGAVPGSVGSYHWSGVAGTQFFVDPAERMFALLMVQAPSLQDELGSLFRSHCYAAVEG